MNKPAQHHFSGDQPSFTGHPANWNGHEFAAGAWWREIKEHEIATLEQMIQTVSQRIGDDIGGLLSCPIDDIPGANFPGNGIECLVANLRRELIEGKGFAVLRGLPLDSWSRREAAIAYWVIGNHLGSPVSNNGRGDMMCDIVDNGVDYKLATSRGYDSNAKLSYHCDQCDVVGLLCLQSAKKGGLSKLVSAMAVHDEILERRPDLLKVLSEPFHFSRLGEISSGQLAWYVAPVFDYSGGGLHCAAGINHIRKGHELPGAPGLTDQQLEALELVEDVCQSIEFSMPFAPGDIQFLNNGLILHTRTAFEDWPEPERRRHLLRMWFRIPELHVGAAYFENWRNGVSPADGTMLIRPTL